MFHREGRRCFALDYRFRRLMQFWVVSNTVGRPEIMQIFLCSIFQHLLKAYLWSLMVFAFYIHHLRLHAILIPMQFFLLRYMFRAIGYGFQKRYSLHNCLSVTHVKISFRRQSCLVFMLWLTDRRKFIASLTKFSEHTFEILVSLIHYWAIIPNLIIHHWLSV
jgi:hypothetical protein